MRIIVFSIMNFILLKIGTNCFYIYTVHTQYLLSYRTGPLYIRYRKKEAVFLFCRKESFCRIWLPKHLFTDGFCAVFLSFFLFYFLIGNGYVFFLTPFLNSGNPLAVFLIRCRNQRRIRNLAQIGYLIRRCYDDRLKAE